MTQGRDVCRCVGKIFFCAKKEKAENAEREAKEWES